MTMTTAEEQRVSDLVKAQTKAEGLFNEIEARGLIRSHIMEAALNADIYALAKETYGITTYWHKRIVRAGKNTLLPYAENPPDLTIGEDDTRGRAHSAEAEADLGSVGELPLVSTRGIPGLKR
jgi:Xaa-Pro dipeptidase